MSFNYYFGHNDVYGIEVSILSYDPIDYEVHLWDWISIKFLAKVFIPVYVFGVEIGRDRISVGALNCFLSVFYN